MNKQKIKKAYYEMIDKDAEEILSQTGYKYTDDMGKRIIAKANEKYPEWNYIGKLMYSDEMNFAIFAKMLKRMFLNEQEKTKKIHGEHTGIHVEDNHEDPR